MLKEQYKRFRRWLTLTKATKIYLWWVVIHWFLRWAATFAFLYWVWFLATDARKDEFKNQIRFKVQAPTVEMSLPMTIRTEKGNRNVNFTLLEDGSVKWTENNEKTTYDYK